MATIQINMFCFYPDDMQLYTHYILAIYILK